MNIDGNKYNVDVKVRILKKVKSGSIAFIEDKDRLSNGKIYHAHWEDYLSSSDFFKNWRERIKSFQTEKEVNFYTDRLGAFIDFVKENTRKKVNYIDENSPKMGDPINTPKLIEQELKRLETISEEEFRKTDKGSNAVEFREMTVKEISDMLEYVPNKADNSQSTFGKKHNDNQNQSERGQGFSVVDQNDNKCMSAVSIFAIIGVVGAIIIAGVVVVKKSLRKPKN